MTAGSVEAVEEPAEVGITQEEAQAIFDQLAEAVGTERFQAMSSRRSQVESVTLTYFDLVAIMTDALNQDLIGCCKCRAA